MLVLFLLVWPDKLRGAEQSMSGVYVSVIPISVARQVAWSRAWAVFYVSVIPISVARQVSWSRAEHERSFMLVLFLLEWPDK